MEELTNNKMMLMSNIVPNSLAMSFSIHCYLLHTVQFFLGPSAQGACVVLITTCTDATHPLGGTREKVNKEVSLQGGS